MIAVLHWLLSEIFTHTHTHIQVFALKGQSDPDLHSFLRVGHGYPTIQVNSVYNEKKSKEEALIWNKSDHDREKVNSAQTHRSHSCSMQGHVSKCSYKPATQFYCLHFLSICSPLLQLTVWSYTSFKKGMFDIPLWREWPTISIMKRMANNIRWNCLLSTVI